jgi:Uma2 family endonuclease
MTMTDPLVRPALGDVWTIEDLRRLPHDGTRYELIDGSLLVSPAPAKPHFRAVNRLVTLLRAHAPAHLVVGENAGIAMSGRRTYRIPDISVLHVGALDGDGQGFDPGDVVLAVEVVSPDSAGDDLVMKRYQYGKEGIPHYWIVDQRRRELTVLRHDGVVGYADVAVVGPGDRWRAAEPFPVPLDGSALA